jgi:hypothetical protein
MNRTGRLEWMGYNIEWIEGEHIRTILAPTQPSKSPHAARAVEAQHQRVRLGRAVRARQVDRVVERVGGALWRVVLGMPLNQWVVPQPAVPFAVAAQGMSMLAAPARVAAASKRALEVGRMGWRDAGMRTAGLRISCLFCGRARAR